VRGRVLRFPSLDPAPALGREAAQRALEAAKRSPRDATAKQKLEHPETLLAICDMLRGKLESTPATVREDASFLYRFIEKPKRPIGLFDEREYFLGEFALLAGTACRQLSAREEAHLWFDRAEAGFRHTINAEGDLSRLGYQRLAERLEERQLDVVLELAPPLIESLRRLGLRDEALKCSFLEAIALMESDEVQKSIECYESIRVEAQALQNHRLLASAYANLTHAYSMVGCAKEALDSSSKAIPILKRLDDRVGLAKAQWGVATLMRETGQLDASIAAFRDAQEQFGVLGMRADIAALNLVVADMLLDLGQDAEALREIAAALPVIDELKMAPEGMAALSLLRESARRQEVNRAALRELHGYFPQPDA
jgi:tetratricopeptide (TPR) repeat protein